MTLSPADVALADEQDTERSRAAFPWWGWLLGVLLIFGASVLGVRLAPPGSQVAIWWPAAGLSVLLVLLVRGRRERAAALAAIFVATALANAAAGRPVLVSSAFGLANAVEALVVVAILLRVGGPGFRLRDLDSALRFAGAVLAGAVAIGVLAAAAVVVFEGGSFFTTAAFVAASHAAAVFMIAPFGLLPPRIPVRATVVEMVVQGVALAAVIVVVFHPAVGLPLAFLPYPVLSWAAFRFPIRVAVTETLLASMAMLALTIAGGGPFNHSTLDFTQRAALGETFLVTFAGFAIVLAAAQYELRATTRQLLATSRLLSGSLVEASVGLLIGERSRVGELRVIWRNPTAAALLPQGSGRRWEGELADAARSALTDGAAITVTCESGTLTVAANGIPDEPDRFAVQLVDVTDTLRMQAATLAAEAEQEAARTTRMDLERQREDFVATTSHELRTPITSIVGFCELLAESDALGDQEKAWVEVIDRNAVRLSSLVEDLLTLGAVARPVGALAEADVDAQIHDVVSASSVIAAKKRIDLSTQGHAGTARAEPADVGRILTNLVANAVKFTPDGGRVTVTSSAGEATITVVVADTGPGMSEEIRAHAFDRFYRAPGMQRDAVPGTGLGLAIVAELVERNGGSVRLDSPPIGGTRATIELPTSMPAARQASAT
ncbi:ATP-binding protein [Leifsonia sp. NPDC056665]|uniref:ATP-binding protein n=1 Tax=Leifsonia sp. NPDC056665 TaxID=3345901 RepID=UPI0036B0FC34